MYKVRSLISVFAAAATVAVFAVPAFAQVEGWGSDVENFSVPSPAQMTTEASGADFSAALEAASASEGRGGPAAPKPAAAPALAQASTPGSESAAKNEAGAVSSAGKADTAAKAKAKDKPKTAGNAEKLKNNMGARFGVGRDMDISIGFGIGLSSAARIVTGLNAGWGVSEQHNFATYEAFGFFDWNINLSDDGALRWFFGPGVTFGFYSVEKDEFQKKLPPGTYINGSETIEVKDTIFYDNKRIKGEPQFSIGIGGRTGLEVDLSFIDPDHALSMLRSSSVSLDVRLVLYWPGDEWKNYPAIMPSLGITYNYVFGGGKDKK